MIKTTTFASFLAGAVGFGTMHSDTTHDGGHMHSNMANHPCAYDFTAGELVPGHAFFSGHLPKGEPKPMNGYFCPHHAVGGDSKCFSALKGAVHDDDGIFIAVLEKDEHYPKAAEASISCRMPMGEHCSAMEPGAKITANYGVLISAVHDSDPHCYHGDIKALEWGAKTFASASLHSCGYQSDHSAMVYDFVQEGEEAPYGVDSVFCELLPDGVNYDGKWEGSSSDKECSTEVCPYEKHVNIENHPCAYGFTGGEKAPGHAFVSGHLAANMPKLMDGFFCPHHALDGSSACFKANAGDVHQDDGVMVAELDAGGIYPENSEASFACRMPKGERCIIAVQGEAVPHNYGVLVSVVHDSQDHCYHGDVKVLEWDAASFEEAVKHPCGYKSDHSAIVYDFVKKGETIPTGVDSIYCELVPDGVNYDGMWKGTKADDDCAAGNECERRE